MGIQSKPNHQRHIRTLPGRARIEIYGLKQNAVLAQSVIKWFSLREGIYQIDPCVETGRALFTYDEKLISLASIIGEIQLLESPSRLTIGSRETAAAAEGPGLSPTLPLSAQETRISISHPGNDFSGALVTANTSELSIRRVPLSLALSVGGLAFLGVKQLLLGKSALAKSSSAFNLAALIAVASGYLVTVGHTANSKEIPVREWGPPALEPGHTADSNVKPLTGNVSPQNSPKKFAAYKQGKAEFVLGAGALALALARENLVVLAGLSILQYARWKRQQLNFVEVERPALPEEITSYAEKAGRINTLLAGATWAMTGSPVSGMSVLLAGNPRVATLPAKYALEQAETEAKENGLFLPENCSLSELGNVNTVVFPDTSLMVQNYSRDIQCLADGEAEAKVWHLAASLMKKTGHPWQEQIRKKAQKIGGTIRTAFKVEQAEQGVKAQVQRTEVLMGSIKFLEQNGVNCDPYLLDVKRKQRAGFDVLCLARDKVYLGALLKYRECIVPEFLEEIQILRKHDIRVGVLNNSLDVGEDVLIQNGIEQYPIHRVPTVQGVPPGGLNEPVNRTYSRVEDIHSHKLNMARGPKNTIFITEESNGSLAAPAANYYDISVNDLNGLTRSVEYAFKVKETVQGHFRLGKAWNTFGALLAIPLAITAPVANLLSDALTLIFLARSKRLVKWDRRQEYTPANEPGVKNSGTQVLSNRVPSTQVLSTQVLRHPFPQMDKGKVNQAAPGNPSGVLWHAVSKKHLLREFGVDERRGLTSGQVLAFRERYGLNQLDQKKQAPWLYSYMAQFKEFTTLVILGTSLLALASGDWFDGLAMGAILLANAAIGTVQERKAERVIEALNEFQPPTCKVLREERILEIVGTELVPGDIVRIEAGDRVPADLRLLEGRNLEVNEAALTGESLPVGKSPKILGTDISLAERKNMLYMGTDVTRGNGLGIVVQTGMGTEIGYLMALMTGQERVVTPLHERVTGISKAFVKGAALAGAIVFLAGLLRGRPLRQMITTSITLAASAVPEGLPVTITIALSAGIYRMAKKNALIRKLSALETLGRTTVICTDKTGTLTKNEMTVKRIATLKDHFYVSGNGYEPEGIIAAKSIDHSADPEGSSALKHFPGSTGYGSDDAIQDNPELNQLARIAILCNNSKLEREDGYWNVKGDPTEGALLTLAGKLGQWTEKMTHWHRVHEVPFDSNSGTMTVVCKDTQADKDCYIFCKGSVEAILDHCRWYQLDGEVYPLTGEQKAVIYQQNETFARAALRVLAFAYCPTEWMEGEPKVLDDELIYVGLAGMMDPPKPEVEKSIREAYALRVKPVMITGDHPVTAIAISKELGIGNGDTRVLTGKEMDELSDAQLVEIVESISIFARVTPEHKLRIVTAYQKCGHIVAMTGDGVNDTPAIKQSNVGIAMGRTGTEVTKATADMVLKKDHFGSILEGVKEGRTIIGNIRKAIGCLLTGNLAEILVTGAAVIVGLPMPLVPIQILLMNLLTDAIPAVILSINPGNKTKQTKRQDIVDKELYQKVITRGVLLGAGSLGLFALSLAAGVPLGVAQTAAFTTLVVGQLAQTLSWRQEGSEESMRDSLRDRYLAGGLGASFLALLAAIYIPPLAQFFHTTPLLPQHWLAALLVAGSVSLLSKPFLYLVSGSKARIQKTEARSQDSEFRSQESGVRMRMLLQ